MKKIRIPIGVIAVLFLVVLSYIIIGFIVLQFNPLLWHWSLRGVLAVITLIFTGIEVFGERHI